MEQFVIVLVIAAVAFVKWLMEKSAEQRMRRANEVIRELERNNPPLRPEERAIRPIDPFPRPVDTSERRLREALGIPDDAQLSPPRRTAPQGPAFRAEEVAPPADLERRVMPPPAAVPKTVSKRKRQEAPAESPRASGLDELLRSRDGLRRAIVAQEILGTPKGLVF